MTNSKTVNNEIKEMKVVTISKKEFTTTKDKIAFAIIFIIVATVLSQVL
jgi:hypothetical protein